MATVLYYLVASKPSVNLSSCLYSTFLLDRIMFCKSEIEYLGTLFVYKIVFMIYNHFKLYFVTWNWAKKFTRNKSQNTFEY